MEAPENEKYYLVRTGVNNYLTEEQYTQLIREGHFETYPKGYKGLMVGMGINIQSLDRIQYVQLCTIITIYKKGDGQKL